jgi:hypothetical protein
MIVAEEVPYLKDRVSAPFPAVRLAISGTDVTENASYGRAENLLTPALRS